MKINYYKRERIMNGQNIEITFPVGVLDDGVDDIEYSQDALIAVNQFVQSYISTENICKRVKRNY